MVVGYNSESLNIFTKEAQYVFPSLIAPSETEPQNEKNLGRAA